MSVEGCICFDGGGLGRVRGVEEQDCKLRVDGDGDGDVESWVYRKLRVGEGLLQWVVGCDCDLQKRSWEVRRIGVVAWQDGDGGVVAY